MKLRSFPRPRRPRPNTSSGQAGNRQGTAMRTTRNAKRLATFASLGLLAVWALPAAAEGPALVRAPDPAPRAAKAPEKKVAFEMRDKPWSAVLEWLADLVGLPVVTNEKPTGTFTFIAPGKGAQYTVP